MSIYPLPMRFPVPVDGSAGLKAREENRQLRVGEYVDIMVTAERWSFITASDRATFEAMPTADRVEYRKAFAAQVRLAKETV